MTYISSSHCFNNNIKQISKFHHYTKINNHSHILRKYSNLELLVSFDRLVAS